MKRLTFLFGLTLVLSLHVFAQNTVDPPLITVSGQADVRVTPDEVVFSMIVEAVNKDMLVAKAKTDAAVRAVLAIAKTNQIKDEDVQTSQISVKPKFNTDDLPYDQRRIVKQEFIGYEIFKTIAVRLRDISRFDGFLSDVLKAGVTRVTNFQFQASNIRQHKDKARAMAMRAAREKATLLATEIGQSIGPAYSITEENQRLYSNSNITQNSMTADGDSVSDGMSTIAPGIISVSAQVTVKFRLN
ncbi:MAG TPA: SIMPL domain-containing protein [Pyrinomonadaceae bacterium]|nr:SIMPL domain-containing protein [Pyrinomonadaceae bacterium]